MNMGKIFNTQEMQNILSGNKTMFREVIKPQPKEGDAFLFDDEGQIVFQEDCCPYQVGQKIFVKESFWVNKKTQKFCWYDNDIFECGDKVEKKPASQMKQERSRLTLLIKEIRVEKLQNISEEDAIAEGIPLSVEFKDRYYTPENNYAVPKIAFMRWWNSTHKKPEEKFEANPFVWSIQFEVVK